jgi:zinc protease
MFIRVLRASLALAISLFASPALLAQPALPAGITKVTSVEGIDEYRLANGLQILLVPDDSKPTVTVNVTYKVGSKQENYGETGMAHLLEHLIFKGTPTTPLALAEFAKRGFRPNGSTWTDRTNYFASFAYNEENLRWYLSWQADAMVNSFIARKDLDSEMTVVRNEMEMGENSPFRVLLQKVGAAAYQWHNYGKSTIGARSDVENVNIERLQAFYRLHYQPDNAVLIVSGKFKPEQVLAWAADYFGNIPKPTRVLPPIYTIDPAQDGERSVTLRRTGGAPLVVAAYKVPGAGSADFAAIQAAMLIMGDTPSGRLHKRLVETKLAGSSFAFAFSFADPTLAFLAAQLAPDQDLEKARAALLATVESVATEPVTQAELDRAKTKWLKNWELGFTDPERVGITLSEAIGAGDWRLFFLARDRMRALTLADTQRVVSQYFVRDNRTLGEYIPTEKPVRAPAPQFVDVGPMVAGYTGDAKAAQVEAFDPTPANIDARTQTFTLANGLKVAVLAKGSRGGTVNANLSLNLSDEKSALNQEEIGGAVASMLNKGSKTMTRQQIADRLDQLKARVGFGGSATGLSASIQTTRENLPAVIALVGQLLREPVFPVEALDEYKAQVLTGIAQNRKEPQAVVENIMDRHGNPYPKGDVRYSATFDEKVAEINGLTVNKLKAFHQRFAGASFGQLGVVGDLDPAALKTALDKALGDWKTPAPYVRVPNPYIEVKPARFVLNTPDKQNAFMQVQQNLPLSDNDPDYAALSLANYILGGNSDSRLWARIRDKDGLSYGVSASIQWNSHEPNSSWQFEGIYAPENRAKIEAAFKEEVARALKDGFTQAELDAKRTGLLGLRKLSRAQDGNLAGALANNLYLNRTFARSQQVDDAISALTVEQVNAALRKYIKPETFVYGFGGDFK